MKYPQILGIISIKGGVGKTSIAANLAATLASKFNKKALVVDANFSAPNLGFHVGLINPKSTIHTVMKGKSRLFEAIYHHPSGFDVLPGSVFPEKVNPMRLEELLKPLKYYYHYILLDSSPALNDETYSVISAANELLVVSSPDYPTLSSTLHAIKIAKSKDTPIKGIIINKKRGKSFELSKEDIEKASGVNVISVISDDVSILRSLSDTKPVTIDNPRARISKEYEKLASELLGEKSEESKFKSFLGWFKSNFKRDERR